MTTAQTTTSSIFSMEDELEMWTAVNGLSSFHIQSAKLTNVLIAMGGIGVPYYMNLSPQTYARILDSGELT